MSLISLNNHEFIFKTNPPEFFDNTSERGNFKYFPKILLYDSLLKFFPVAEVHFKDKLGVIPDVIYFQEGLEAEIKLGNKDDGYLGTDFIWSKCEMSDIEKDFSFSGTDILIFGSKYLMRNEKKSKSWKGTVNSVINDILTSDYNLIDAKKKFVAPTIGSDYWYQVEIRNSDWIQRIANNAYSRDYPTHPFYTFFNCNGEFYFYPLGKFFEQKEINEEYYVMEEKEDSFLNPYALQDYYLQYGGYPINFDNYKIKTFKLKNTSDFESKEYKIEDHIYKESGEKFLVRKKEQTVKQDVDLGIYDTVDKEFYEARVNNLFRDSALSYRMGITIPFNPLAVSGKTIKIKVEESLKKGGLMKEYTGKWLIIQSKHYADQDGKPYSSLLLAKSALYVDKNHTFINEFL